MNIKKMFTFVLAISLGIGFGSFAFAAGGGAVLADPGSMEGKHFHPKGKMPSTE